MKQLFLGLLLISTNIVVFGQVELPDCNRFKTGKFSYSIGDTIYIINRGKKKQTEKNTKTGERVTFNVKWTGDCTYNLLQRWSTDKKGRKQNGHLSKVKIINTTPNSYESTCVCPDNSQTASTLVTIIEDIDPYEELIKINKAER